MTEITRRNVIGYGSLSTGLARSVSTTLWRRVHRFRTGIPRMRFHSGTCEVGNLPARGRAAASANESHRQAPGALRKKKKFMFWTRLNQDYPQILAEIENPPPVLFYKGYLPSFDEKGLRPVGSRKPTKNGFSIIRSLTNGLAGEKE